MAPGNGQRSYALSDVGASTRIIYGQIKAKSGPKPEGFDETGAPFDDGSKIEVNAVVLAAG